MRQSNLRQSILGIPRMRISRIRQPLLNNGAVQGFTLIELVTVIIILGVVSIGIAGFLRGGFQIYSDSTERQQILSETRFAVERLNREFRMAIPNSLRVSSDTSLQIQCVEFVPAEWVSFYTYLPVYPSTETQLRVVEFADNGNQFSWQSGDYAFVYPTSSEDVYASSSDKRRATLACSDSIDGDGNADGDGDCNTADSSSHTAQLTVSSAFADDSPASRLYFGRKTVSFCAHDNAIYRYQDSTINDTQQLYSGGQLMAEHLVNDLSQTSELPFAVSEPTLNRNGLVHVLLTFELNEEKVNYNLEVHIPNVP